MLSISLAAQTVPDQPLTFPAATERALLANPTIAAARARGAIALAGIAVARQRPNPELRLEFERETPHRAYGGSFPWELGGKRAKRIAVSEATLGATAAELARTIVEVRISVRRAYFDLLVAEQRRALRDELQALSARLRDAAQQRFEAGSAPRLELLQAELLLAQARNEADAARGLALATRAQLNALLAFPADAAVPLAGTLDTGPVLAVDAALANARSASAELAVLDRRLDEQRARIALARALQVPDVITEGSVTRGAEPEFSTGWRAAFGIVLPVFTLSHAAVRLEEATLSQLKLERDAVLARITGEVASAATVAETQRQQYLRYRDQILPQALEVERMAEDSYRLGQTGLAALLQAVQASRDARLRWLQAGADLQNALADLERSIGAPLP